jgi:acylphosphatase
LVYAPRIIAAADLAGKAMSGRESSESARVTIRVTGRVQGVAFRWHTREQACRLGVVGHVRNLPDGSVVIVAEGTRAALDALSDWASRGPDIARVDSREANWAAAEGTFTDFRISG